MKRTVWLGGKPAAISRKMTLARLAKIRNLFAEISCIWSDEDSTMENQCEEEIEHIRQFERDWADFWAEKDAEELRQEGGAA